jgi:hypothetical protein
MVCIKLLLLIISRRAGTLACDGDPCPAHKKSDAFNNIKAPPEEGYPPELPFKVQFLLETNPKKVDLLLVVPDQKELHMPLELHFPLPCP